MSIKFLRSVIASILVLSLCVQPVMATHSYNGSERLVRDLVRVHRGWISTTPLLSHEARDRAHEVRAEYLRTGRVSHAGAFDEVSGCWWLGEVIAYTNGFDSYITSGAWVVRAWHRSPSHEAVLHGRWTRFGVGAVREGNLRFYVVVFGRRC